MDPLTILAALGPVAVNLVNSLIGRFISPDGFKPTNIEDYTKMKAVDLEMFKAMNDAGGTNPSYPWVEAVVRLMRPGVAIIVLGTWAAMEMMGTATPTVANFASSVGFYLFGDRTLFYSQKKV
jgi:hypothetical protein